MNMNTHGSVEEKYIDLLKQGEAISSSISFSYDEPGEVAEQCPKYVDWWRSVLAFIDSLDINLAKVSEFREVDVDDAILIKATEPRCFINETDIRRSLFDAIKKKLGMLRSIDQGLLKKTLGLYIVSSDDNWLTIGYNGVVSDVQFSKQNQYTWALEYILRNSSHEEEKGAPIDKQKMWSELIKAHDKRPFTDAPNGSKDYDSVRKSIDRHLKSIASGLNARFPQINKSRVFESTDRKGVFKLLI